MRLFNRAARKETRASYTDLRIADATAAVQGDGVDAAAIAAVQAAAGQWARAFAVATVVPETPVTRALTASVLHDLGRSLVLYGEACWLIDVADSRLQLHRASDWDIFGVRKWTYRLTISGPSGTLVRRVPADSVLHPRINQDPATPYQGQSPVKLAGLTSGLAAHLEKSLRNEAKSNTGYVIPAPTDGMGESELTELRGDVTTLKGRTALVPGMQRAWGDSGVGPGTSNWKVQRIGIDPPESLVTLRSDAGLAVLAACGVPAELYQGKADGTARREAWRVFLHGTIQGAADVVSAELSEKLETPVTLNFDRLFASDVQGRARAFASLIGTGGEGLDTARAAELAGFDN